MCKSSEIANKIESNIMSKSAEVVQSLENAMMQNNLASMTPKARLLFVKRICDGMGLAMETMPFEFINFKGQVKLYATKGCAEQLRQIHKVSLKITDRQKIDDLFMVTCEATDKNGRIDSAIGVVSANGKRGDDLANAFMKAETKAKRRVTLSICGLNMLDEVELESVKEYTKMNMTVDGELSDGDVIISEQRKEEKEEIKKKHSEQDERLNLMRAQSEFSSLWKDLFNKSKSCQNMAYIESLKEKYDLKSAKCYKYKDAETLDNAIKDIKSSISALNM